MVKLIDIKIVPSWSCYLCQEETKQPYWLDMKAFCSSKHAFNLVWREIFGEVEKLSPEKREAYKIYFRMELPAEIIWHEGWSNEQIEAAYVGLFNLKPTTRQAMAYQITKYILGKFSKEVPEYAKD